MNRNTGGTLTLLCAAALALLSGCASFGPRTLNSDQLDYGHSIGDTWKNQMLANLVKIRFLDMPVFMDVGQIVSGYTIETKVSGGLGFSNSLTGGDSQVLGAEGRFTDRPTITYMPKTGEDYLRSLLDPIDPGALLSLVLADYSAKLLFTWAVQSINGVENYAAREAGRHLISPEYREFIKLVDELQPEGVVGFSIEKDPETSHEVILFFNNANIDDAQRRKIERLRELIGLDTDGKRYRVVFSPFPLGEDVLAIQTRSVIQMLTAMAKFVDIPAERAARAIPGIALPEGAERPFHVHTSKERPEDAFAVFQYSGDWYWIDHEDLRSKRVFLLMLFLTTLTNQGSDDNIPVLTIPTS